MGIGKARPEDYQFASPEVNACPYPFYEAVRDDCPAYKLPGQEAFLVAGYEHVRHAATTPQVFSSHRPRYEGGDPEMQAMATEGYPSVPALVTVDPPEHTRFKKLVMRPFTARSVAAREGDIRRYADALIDEFADRGRVELLSEFSMPLATRVTGELLGVPVEDQGRFQTWADDIADASSRQITRERALECKRSIVEMQQYFAALIEERRGDPGDDVVSDMVVARVSGERPLEVPEMLELIGTLLAGGVESTASLISSAMYHLLLNPDQMDKVRDDGALIPRMLEEALRMESPVQWNLRMIERESVEFHGVELPKNSRVMVSWAAGNRDPEAFGDDADTFDIFREVAVNHLAFGHGPHFCLGAALARTEARIAFEQLFSRLTDIRFAVPAEDLTFVGAFVRRLEQLPLEFNVAA